MSLSYIGENINKYHEPQIKLEGTTIKVDFKHFNENLKINFSNELISKNELSLINISLKRFDEFDIKSNSYNLKKFQYLVLLLNISQLIRSIFSTNFCLEMT